jgi:drug/metabolite transporter (DMT)-like permease
MKYRIWSAMIVVYLVWGSTYLAIRFAVETLPPFLMASTRFLIAGSILYGLRRLMGDPAPTRREWRSSAIVGLFLLIGGNGGVVWAEQRVPSGITALMVGSAPLWMVLIDALNSSLFQRSGGGRGRRYSLQTYAGVLIGLLGVTLLIGPTDLLHGSLAIDPAGAVVLLFAGFFWAVGSLYNREACLPDSPLLGTGMEMLVGGAGLLILGTLSGDWTRLNLHNVATPSLLGLAYLILFGSLAGYSAYTWLLRSAPTPLVSTYAYVNPVIAIFLGNLLAQEPLTPRILLATAVILGALALINTARGAPVKSQPTVPAAVAVNKDCV